MVNTWLKYACYIPYWAQRSVSSVVSEIFDFFFPLFLKQFFLQNHVSLGLNILMVRISGQTLISWLSKHKNINGSQMYNRYQWIINQCRYRQSSFTVMMLILSWLLNCMPIDTTVNILTITKHFMMSLILYCCQMLG